MVKEVRDGIIPSDFITAENIPEAHWKCLHSVFHKGYELRTSYDRRNSQGAFIDPPGMDEKFMMQINDPFAQPRYSVLCWENRGRLIAEYLGAKSHLVVPYEELFAKVQSGQEFEATVTPYQYIHRLTAYPCKDGSTLNQLDRVLEMLTEDLLTRRAVATTRVPEIDLFLKGDLPCLGEVQFRAIEDETSDDKRLCLGMHVTFRSWDFGKALGDNLVALTNIHSRVAYDLQERIQRAVVPKPLYCVGNSGHIYGQDIAEGGGGKFDGESFFQQFPTAESFVKRAWTSEKALEGEVLPGLTQLKNESTWKFPPEAIKLIERIEDEFRTGKFVC